jgi:hypothetical protein
MFLGVFRDTQIKSTLHALAKEGTGLFSKRMMHHGQGSFRTLICAPPWLFDPEFVCVFWRFTTHIDYVGVLCDIIATVLDAVVFLVIHDVESISVFIGKDLLALFKITDKQSNLETNIVF